MIHLGTDANVGRASNALFNDNRLKLGLFGPNCDSGCAMTDADERLRLTWEATKRIAIAADEAGFEAIVPVARWKGLGGRNNFNGKNFETYTWAAGLASVTKHITLVTTSHVQTVHPILAAKQAVTVDHISGGRFALNIVCGWFTPELEMFGAPILPHDTRYDFAEEWLEIARSLWTKDDEFNFKGTYFNVNDGYAQPKPIQAPYPPLINAGGSPRGKAYIAKNCDIAYVLIADYEDLEKSRKQIEQYREVARKEYGREIQVWTHAYVVQRDTDEEAERFLNYYVVEKGNDAAAESAAHFLGVNSEIMSYDAWSNFKFHLKAGWGGYPLVGTADRIAQRLLDLSNIGIDGVSCDWVDWNDGIERFSTGVMPQLEKAGLRKPYRHTV